MQQYEKQTKTVTTNLHSFYLSKSIKITVAKCTQSVPYADKRLIYIKFIKYHPIIHITGLPMHLYVAAAGGKANLN